MIFIERKFLPSLFYILVLVVIVSFICQIKSKVFYQLIFFSLKLDQKKYNKSTFRLLRMVEESNWSKIAF